MGLTAVLRGSNVLDRVSIMCGSPLVAKVQSYPLDPTNPAIEEKLPQHYELQAGAGKTLEIQYEHRAQ